MLRFCSGNWIVAASRLNSVRSMYFSVDSMPIRIGTTVCLTLRSTVTTRAAMLGGLLERQRAAHRPHLPVVEARVVGHALREKGEQLARGRRGERLAELPEHAGRQLPA